MTAKSELFHGTPLLVFIARKTRAVAAVFLWQGAD
jgi:hypothetical protein